MRKVTRPTTAKCALPMYIGFLITKSPTCTRLAEVTGISHDSVNRFLHRENYQPKDLFDEVTKGISLEGGTLSVDDTVLDKPYSFSMDLVGHFWSGKHHKTSYLQKMVLEQAISTMYQHYWELFKEVTASFIEQFIADKNHLLPQLKSFNNA